MLKRMMLLMLVCGGLIAGKSAAQGQTDQPETPPVYVTTQDYAALRAGPGRHWQRLAALPYGATYRATARTIDAEWIQIAYEGELDPDAPRQYTRDGVTYGWVVYWLLVWSGDILQLPIDGQQFTPTARAAGPTMVLYPDEYMYEGGVDPSTRVDNPMDTPVMVEVTGRLGSPESGYFLLQFKLNNHYYWTGTWAVGVPRGYAQLPDAAYLYPYGRLLLELRSELGRAGGVLSDIGGRWRALDEGRTTTCNAIPADFQLRETSFSATDLNIEPIYRPMAEALRSAQVSINAALARFRDVCARPGDRQVRPEDIHEAMLDVREAERSLTIVRTLLAPLQRTDPVFDRGE